jgi:LacI family transcriptional regulator
VVNVCGVLPDLPFPRVGIDDHAVGAAAAAHFLERGFRHFAFVGHTDHAYSTRRERGFAESLRMAGHSPACFREAGRFDPRGRVWALDPRLSRWVRALPKPVGLFACNDVWGCQLSEACRQSEVAVPEEVAILGVDNDDLLCELARPSLSSVAVPGEAIGFEAAALLDRMLSRGPGEARPGTRKPPLLLPPRQVVTRRSSDILAVDDPYVAEALGVIRRRAGRAMSVDDVVDLVPLSRRSLERRFRSCLGRGVWEEIRRVQLERAKELLAGTELPMSAVAAAAGFSESKQLSVVFRQETRMTPTAFRRQTRPAGPGAGLSSQRNAPE